MSDERPILLVEDDQNDVFFLKYAFQAAAITNPLCVVQDGQAAMDYLAGAREFADRTRHPLPFLLLLDLKLPVRPGLDVLRWLRQQSRLQTLLIIILTSSANAQDVNECYRLGAHSFLVKPLTLEDRIGMAKAFKRYWLELNTSPSLGNP